jgi:hypothetical protein
MQNNDPEPGPKAFQISSSHPLMALLRELIHEETTRHIDSRGLDAIESYLAGLLAQSAGTDFSLRGSQGERVTSIFEMLAEADVRLKADSFLREREVHKQIGDNVLFWTSVYPESLAGVKELYASQGRTSYHIVSTFDHPPFEAEAPTFRLLSEGFDDFAFVVGQVGKRLRHMAA